MLIYLGAERGPTSRDSLLIDWDYPVFSHEEDATGQSRAKARRQALERSLAFREIVGDDQRPLLVLRECLACNGTDDALLSRQSDNEKTMLLSRFFHCVKLPPEVTDADHPFHALFPGEEPPHLFVVRPNGEALLPLTGEQSRTELWDVMGRALRVAYADDPHDSLRDLSRCLDQLDVIDEKLAQVEKRIERELEDRGPRSRKLKKLEGELQELREERAALKTRMQVASRYELKAVPEASKAG